MDKETYSSAKKQLEVITELLNSDNLTIENRQELELLSAKLKGGKNVIDEEKNLLLEKIEQVKKKEIVRLKDESEKAGEKKRKREKPYIERFSKIKPSLQELKQIYSKDEDINVEIDSFSAHLTIRGGWELLERNIDVYPGDLDEKFDITDSKYHYENKEFNKPEETIDYIVEQVGKFLAERESR